MSSKTFNLGTIFFPTFIIALVILVLSVSEIGDVLNKERGFGDKMGHFSAYFVLSVVFTTACLKLNLFEERTLYIYCSFVIGLYGAVLELVQHFLPHRHGDIYDLITNSIAALCGAFFVRIYLGRIRI